MNTVKQGDRVITAIHYEDTRNKLRIASVEVYDYDGQYLVRRTTLTRQEVISAIRNRNQRFVTAYKRNGQWHWGEDVRAFTRNGRDYIRTYANNIEADNLGDLPEF